jgi:uncharacterized protein (UPF0332 family)
MSVNELIAKADRAIQSAKILYESQDTEGACNRAYYAIFDAAKAILQVNTSIQKIGKTHSGLIAAFGLHLVKPGIIPHEFGQTLSKAHNLRLLADYTDEFIESNDVIWLINEAECFVEMVKNKLIPQSD